MAARYDGMPHAFGDTPLWLPNVPQVVPYPLHRMPRTAQEPVFSPGCCPSGPLHSPTGLHAFVHCPEMCTTCSSGTGSLHHPYMILPWDASHGIVHKEVVAEYPENERRARFLDEHERRGRFLDEHERRERFLDEDNSSSESNSDRAITDHRRGKWHHNQEKLPTQGTPPRKRKRKRNRYSGAHSQANTERNQHTFTRVSAQQNDEPTILSNSESRMKFEKLGGQVQRCESCNVICGSWGVLQGHFDSRRHKARVKHLTEEARAGNHHAIAQVQNLENQMKILIRHGFT